MLSVLDGNHRHPERFSRRSTAQVERARRAPGEEQPLVIRCTTRATPTPAAARDGVPVEVLPERPGHASTTITLTVHHHVHPGIGRQAAHRSAALLDG